MNEAAYNQIKITRAGMKRATWAYNKERLYCRHCWDMAKINSGAKKAYYLSAWSKAMQACKRAKKTLRVLAGYLHCLLRAKGITKVPTPAYTDYLTYTDINKALVSVGFARYSNF